MAYESVPAKPCQPEPGHAKRDHGEVVGRPFLVEGHDATVLFEPVDQPHNLVALPVGG